MRIVVSGASGFLGRHLVPHLEARGHRVQRLVRRDARSADEIPWDPKFGRLPGEPLEGVGAVVHLAGSSIAGLRWTLRRKERILRSRVQSTKLLAQRLASLSSPPRVFVSMSATGYYGHGGDRELTEEAAPGRGFLAEVCTAWEAAADPAREAGVRVAHPRPHLVLGRDGGALPALARAFRLGAGGRLGTGEQWISWISIQDCVRALTFLAENETQGPYNVTGPKPVPQRAFARALARVLGRPAWLPAPSFAVRAALGRMGQELLLEGQRAPPGRLLAEGFAFDHPTLEEALRAQWT